MRKTQGKFLLFLNGLENFCHQRSRTDCWPTTAPMGRYFNNEKRVQDNVLTSTTQAKSNNSSYNISNNYKPSQLQQQSLTQQSLHTQTLITCSPGPNRTTALQQGTYVKHTLSPHWSVWHYNRTFHANISPHKQQSKQTKQQ